MSYVMRRPVEPLSRRHQRDDRDSGGPDQVKPTFRAKCPSLRLSTPPPAQCTMNASKMMARIATITQKKNTTMPGMAYPATVLALLAMAASYPLPPDLFGGWLGQTGLSPAEPAAGRRVRKRDFSARCTTSAARCPLSPQRRADIDFLPSRQRAGAARRNSSACLL